MYQTLKAPLKNNEEVCGMMFKISTLSITRVTPIWVGNIHQNIGNSL